MADTLIDVINTLRRSTGGRGNKTTITEVDGTTYFRDRINEALATVYGWGPPQTETNGSLTLPASTRLVAGPTGLDISNIHSWSWRIHDTDGDKPLEQVTKQLIVEQYPMFETDEAPEPRYVYLDGDFAAFYPLLDAGASSLTIQFSYPAQFVPLTLTTDTFPFPDTSDEMFYVKYYAQLNYEIYKGLGQPGVTSEKMDDCRDTLIAKYRKNSRVGITGHRKFNR